MGRNFTQNARGSLKRVVIDKNNARVVMIVSIATFAVIFSLVAANTLRVQAGYQATVFNKKSAALDQIKKNVDAMKQLKSSYDSFVNTTSNVIGGLSTGSEAQDGSNAKIILDALPSRYDFPALTTNVEVLVGTSGAKITGITGTDDEVAQAANVNSPDPQAIEMPFEVTASGDYDQIQKLVGAFERSIWPMKINSLEITGSQGNLNANISAVTYYQPGKSLTIRTEVVTEKNTK